MSEKMIKIVEQSMLYDFYGELLTKHQKKVYEDVVFNDMSPSEIAREENISRQGVHDLIKRCDKILKEYEDKLHLVERFTRTKKDINQIKIILEEYKADNDINNVNYNESNISKIDDVIKIADRVLNEI